MFELINNQNKLLGDDLKKELIPDSNLKIAATYFSMYAFEALKEELTGIEELQFLFTSPTFIQEKVTDNIKKEKREFFIPRLNRETSLYGTEFEIRLKNKLTQKAIAKECAEWIKQKVKFKSLTDLVSINQFINITKEKSTVSYMPLSGFTTVDLGYEKGNTISNFVNKTDDFTLSSEYLKLFNQIWNDSSKVEEVTNMVIDYISNIYTENSPEFIYFLILYNIFTEFLEDINQDFLPNALTGYKDSLIWNKLYNFQRDATTGVINKLEKYNGCILADSVGLGKTFTGLAVIKYYELKNKSVLVLCPKKLASNWNAYKGNKKTNIFLKDRFNYDVLFHTDLGRKRGESNGIKLDLVNWGNYDLIVIDESHNFRNANKYFEHETRYDFLMNHIVREGVKTKVLMLSATPVNTSFIDLKNQLALAYEGESKLFDQKIELSRKIDQIFNRAQRVFNDWRKLPVEARTPQNLLDSLDMDFSILLDSVTIARSRKHIQNFYDTKDIGEFPTRLRPQSYRCDLTLIPDFLSYNEIIRNLLFLKLSIYNPFSYILPSRVSKYEGNIRHNCSWWDYKVQTSRPRNRSEISNDSKSSQKIRKFCRILQAYSRND